MITKEDIEKFIEKIPPAPKVVKETITLLQKGELPKAAKIAQNDPALSSYLRSLVNKPIYGFRNEVKEISQIFGILGVSGSLQAVHNYLLNILAPNKWNYFGLNQKLFYSLQDELTISWNKILNALNVHDREIELSITLLPASIIVAEALFNSHKADVELIRSNKDIDLNTILQRLSGYTLFDICEMIANKWELDEKIAQIIQAASGKTSIADEELNRFGKFMHLLLFYIFSQPAYIEAGLNDFLEFHVEFVMDIYEEFNKIMEIEV